MPDSPFEPADFLLTEAHRHQVLQATIAAIDNYVFPETAAQLKTRLQQQDSQGAFRDLSDGDQFACVLTGHLQDWSGDNKLKVHFSSEPLPDLTPHTLPDAAEIAAEKRRSGLRNFDINRVERLRGNVGYLELYGFEPPELAGDVLAAAMMFLAHTRALIIDLRHNQGGASELVALLCSYLLPAYPPVHLSDLYWRPDNITRQWWTVPYLPGPRYDKHPIYVLTSEETFAAAEEFSYIVQGLKRGIVVGEHTPGGANPGRGYPLSDRFWIFVPTGKITNPHTGQNWADTGIIPDVKVPAELSLLTAHLMALNGLLEADLERSLFREVQHAAVLVDRELNVKRADLISRLKTPTPKA